MAYRFVFVLSVLLFVHIDAHPLDSTLSKCKADNQTTMGQIQCLAQITAAWDTELNAVYRELKKILPPAEFESLKAAQQKWIGYRDAETAFRNKTYSRIGGSLSKVTLLEYKLEIVRSRVLHMQQYLADVKEGQSESP